MRLRVLALCLILPASAYAQDAKARAEALFQDAKALMSKGATKVVGVATHGVLSGPAIQRIVDSPLAEVIVTDTIPLSEAAMASGKIKQVSIAKLLGEAIKRIHSSDSVSSLFA